MEDSLGVPAAKRLDHEIDSKQPVYYASRTWLKQEILGCSLRFRMRLVVHLDQFFHRNVCVDLGSRKARVAEQFLDVAQVGAAVEQVRSKRMAERMWTDVVNAGAEANVFFDHTAD